MNNIPKYAKALVTIALVLCITTSTFAHDIEVDNIFYKIKDNTAKTVSVTYHSLVSKDDSYKYSGDILIPASITHNETTYTVTGIDSDAFNKCENLTSVSIPNTVTEIGRYAFYYCTKLSSVSIPNTVTTINYATFAGCSSLTSITIPNSVTTICYTAFYGCSSLSSITIPASVKSIEEQAFSECNNLSSIIVDSNNPVFDSRDNCNAIIKTTSNTLVAGCNKTIIPNTVTSIGASAFIACFGLTNIAIPNSVTTIGDYAFSTCIDLVSITIPKSVTNIGSCVFMSCINLDSIIVEDGNTYYDSRENCNALIKTSTNTLIAGCNNTVIPNTVTSIQYYAIAYCNRLASITIPNSVTNIEQKAIHSCPKLSSITVENGNSIYDSRENCNAIIETASNSLLLGCVNSTIPSSITKIESYAFSNCKDLVTIDIPSTVTDIGSYAFNNCANLESIIIPNSIERLSAGIFYGCHNLSSITLPSSMLSIGNYAFNNCSNIRSIYCQASTPPYYSMIFADEVYQNATLFIPQGCKSAYENTKPWKNFHNIVETDFSENESIKPDKNTPTEIARFDLSGHKLHKPTSGINIIVMSDNTIKKVIVK